MITAHVEPWPQFVEEAKPLFPEHWAELALNTDKVPLDPQYDVYDAADARGEVLVVTLRELGALVGYYIGFIRPGLHYKTCLTAQMDIFWVRPEYRGRGAGVILFRFVEETLRARGVQRLFVGTKCHKDAGWLFERLGYQEVERYFTHWLGD